MMTTAEIICAAVLLIGMPRAEFACEHMQDVVDSSVEYNIDPILLTALIHVESRWNPKVKSKAGACGLTQIIPKFSRKFGYVGCSQLQKNPELAIRKGAQILSYWYYGYARKNIIMALCAYNAGYICTKYKNKKRIKYPDKVLKYRKKIKIWYDKWIESLEEIPGCNHGKGS